MKNVRGFLSGRVRWPLVLTVCAIVVAVALLFFRYQLVSVGPMLLYRIDTLSGSACDMNALHGAACKPYVSPNLIVCGGASIYSRSGTCPSPSTSARSTPMPSSTPLDPLAAANHAFEALDMAKPENTWSFGSNTTITRLQTSNDELTQVLEATDGSLYAVYYSTCEQGDPGCDAYHLGVFDGDTLREIWLPHGPLSAGQEEWGQMYLLDTSTPDAATVQVSPVRCARPISILKCDPQLAREYRVTDQVIDRVPVTDDDSLSMDIDEHLSDGETCAVDSSAESSTLVDSIAVGGRRRPLVSKHDFSSATGHLQLPPNAIGAYCTHFQGIDILVVEDWRDLIFVITRKGLSLAALAEPFAITSHHMLLWAQTSDERTAGTGHYLDVTRNVPAASAAPDNRR